MKTLVLSLILGVFLMGSITGFEGNNDCGILLGCYNECSGDCSFEVTWKDLSDKIQFSIKAEIPSLSADGDWVSLGLSDDKQMGNDKVLDCITDGTNTFIQHSNNPGKWNEHVSANPTWITAITKSYANNVLTCSFDVMKNNQAGIDFDRDWFLLLARGAWNANTNSKKKHTTFPGISGSKADFKKFQVLGSAPQNIMLKLHGCMMIAAWILCTSIGVVVARYYKPVWLEEKLLGEKVWFTIHRTIMIFAVLFCIAGFVIIFVEKTTFVEVVSDSDFKKAHPFIGIIVMCLAIIQPVMAFCRPHPGDKNRFIFNWAHWLVGMIVHCLAVLNIVIGVLLDAMQLPTWVVYIVVVYAVYQVLIELYLELMDCLSKKKKPSQAYEMREDNTTTKNTDEDSQFTFKKILLGLHIIIVLGFAVALVVLVAMDLSDQHKHND